MQTFVPLASSTAIAQVLDNKRLNKQALEGWQILMNLLELDPEGNHRTPKGWSNHPAVKMWKGHEVRLYLYILAMTDEWKRRGFKTTIADKASATIKVAREQGLIEDPVHSVSDPSWWHLEPIRSSHRRALLVKDYGWYSQFNWPEDPGHPLLDYEYVWPTQKEE
jgi:hypothetical protein